MQRKAGTWKKTLRSGGERKSRRPRGLSPGVNVRKKNHPAGERGDWTERSHKEVKTKRGKAACSYDKKLERKKTAQVCAKQLEGSCIAPWDK